MTLYVVNSLVSGVKCYTDQDIVTHNCRDNGKLSIIIISFTPTHSPGSSNHFLLKTNFPHMDLRQGKQVSIEFLFAKKVTRFAV